MLRKNNQTNINNNHDTINHHQQQQQLSPKKSPLKKRSYPRALLEFCRPHTIIATSLAVITSYFLVTRKGESGIFINNLSLIPFVWLSSVALNIYVVGINQIFDKDIDMINKPFLPLASGEISIRTAWIISLSMALFCLICSYSQSIYLFGTISTILFIGTIYSIPSIYLKGNPLGASLAISLARGLISNLGVYTHFHYLLFNNISIPFSIISFAFFNFGFGIVISLLKDAPDLSGDQLYGVKTLAVRIGVRSVFRIALSILTIFYLMLAISALIELSTGGALLLCISHFIILLLIWIKAASVNYDDGGAVYSYYMFIWNFFYLEFFLFALSVVL